MFRSEASLLFDRPPPSLNAVELGRHSGMDRRTNRQDSRFARLRRPKGEGHGCTLIHQDCRDVDLRVGSLPESSTCATFKLPSMALDSCIPAGMTAFLIVPTLRRGNADRTAPAVHDAERRYGRSHGDRGNHQIKHLHNRPVTVHGLDFGIPAEMTAFFSLVPKLQLGNAELEAPASGVKSSWSLQGEGSQAGAWEPVQREGIRKVIFRIGLIISFALLWSVGSVMAENATSPTPTASKPVYQPPLRGAPDRRVGGGTRGGTMDLSVIAPKQSAWTSQDQPRVYWFISGIPEHGKLAFTLSKASSSKTLYEAAIPMPTVSGIQSYQLTEYRLEPGVEYVWSVSLSFDQDEDRADQVARGGIIYRPLPQDERLEWNHLKEDQLVLLQAKSGYWYDAIESVARLIDSNPRDAQFKDWRKDLLRQVRLESVSNFNLGKD